MELTKEQRHEAYKLALEKMSEQKYMCNAISLAITSIYKISYSFNINNFPEFKSKKPVNKLPDSVWFYTSEYGEDEAFNIRTEILAQCIEETKP